MPSTIPTIPGAEPWSSPGEGANARTGVVVVHGFTGNPISTRPAGERLATHGYAVEVVRLPGHGTNIADLRRSRYADYRAEVERAARDLRSRCDKVVLVGLSMGGMLVLDVASGDGDLVDAVVAINPMVTDPEGIRAKFAPLIAMAFPTLPTALVFKENDVKKPGASEEGYDKVSTRALQSVLEELPRVRAQLLDLQMPVLIAYSPEDHVVPAKNALTALELITSPNVTKLVLENSYHVAMIDNDQELLESAIEDFVAGL